MFIDEREREREGERKTENNVREKHQLGTSQKHPERGSNTQRKYVP